MLYFDLSGWFDSFTFKRWFVDLFLPSVVDKDGPIFLFGDNLGSHFSADLVKFAKENSIHFVMLPANATNWIQVLDMSVFVPVKMKCSWCKILKKWQQETRRTGDIPKEAFPLLLRKLEIDVNQTVSSNFWVSLLWSFITLIVMKF